MKRQGDRSPGSPPRCKGLKPQENPPFNIELDFDMDKDYLDDSGNKIYDETEIKNLDMKLKVNTGKKDEETDEKKEEVEEKKVKKSSKKK